MTAVCPECHARVHGNGRGLCRGSGMVPEACEAPTTPEAAEVAASRPKTCSVASSYVRVLLGRQIRETTQETT